MRLRLDVIAVFRKTEVSTFRDIVRGTNVTRACFERSHPQILIRNAVGANDGQFRKVLMQTFHVRSRQISIFRTTASGWFRATSSRSSSRERVTCTEK